MPKAKKTCQQHIWEKQKEAKTRRERRFKRQACVWCVLSPAEICGNRETRVHNGGLIKIPGCILCARGSIQRVVENSPRPRAREKDRKKKGEKKRSEKVPSRMRGGKGEKEEE